MDNDIQIDRQIDQAAQLMFHVTSQTQYLQHSPQIDRQIAIQIDRQIDGYTDRQIDKSGCIVNVSRDVTNTVPPALTLDRQIDRQIDKQIDKQIDRQIDGYTDRQIEQAAWLMFHVTSQTQYLQHSPQIDKQKD